MLPALWILPGSLWRGRLFPLGWSRRSQVQGGMNHSEAGWQPGDRPDALLMALATSGVRMSLLGSREPRLEHL